MVIGSRFYQGNGTHTSVVRGIGIWVFRLVLRPILGKPVHDPTSGFVGVNRETLQVFTRSFPLEYPEIEALVVLQRKRFRFEEVPVPHAHAQDWPQHHHRDKIAVLYHPCTAGRVCEHPEI